MTDIREVMTYDPAFCTPAAKLEEAARLMVDCDCGEIPVVEGTDKRRLVGVITDRDIVVRTVARGRNPLETDVRDCMTTPAVTVPDTASLEECLRLMQQNQIRRVPVVDDQECLCGIVSQADIAHTVSPEQAGETVRDVSSPVASPARRNFGPELGDRPGVSRH